jgi:hypothetical protein
MASALAAAIALASRAAGAQGANDLQVAQALYDEAAKDVAAKDYAAACPKLEEATRLVPEGVGVRLALGACYEARGRLASALATYEIGEAVAARAHQAARQRYAHDRAATLKPKVAKLRVVVADDVRALPGLEIRRAGSIVGQAQWGLALPADKGPHTVVVTTGDGRRWEDSVEIAADGTTVDLRVELPAPKEPPPIPATPVVVVPASETEPATDSARPRRIAGIVVGSAGLAGLAVGGALGVTAIVKKNQSNSEGCDPTNHCNAGGTDLRWASLRAGDWSTAMLVGGGVALAGGVALFVTARSPAVPVASASVAFGPRGVVVRGAF